MTLPIPERGLAEVLRGWSGRGQLWSALAVPTQISERAWSARDIERRAHRVLLAECEPWITEWPKTVEQWSDSLPAQSARERVETLLPGSWTSWAETRRHGWPPRLYVGRRKYRVADSLMLSSLRWILDELVIIRANAAALDPSLDERFRGRLDVAAELLEIEPVASASGSMPARSDLRLLLAEGHPWSVVAPVASMLIDLAAGSAKDLSNRLIEPDLRWRLFHLGVLGEVLFALRSTNARIVSVRPLTGGSIGPAYRVTDRWDRDWDLWFEAAGIWSYYGRVSPYKTVARAIPGPVRPLGADLMLIFAGERALVMECKFSENAEVVTRDGYLQALAYQTETRSELAGDVAAVVVGPEGVVRSVEEASTVVGKLSICPPSLLSALVRDLVTAP